MGAMPMRLVMRALLAAVTLPAAMGGQGLVSAGAYVDPAHDRAIPVRVEPVPLRLAGAAYQAPSDTATPGTDAAAGAATPAATGGGTASTPPATTPAATTGTDAEAGAAPEVYKPPSVEEAPGGIMIYRGSGAESPPPAP